jgi:hypothetical protein
MLAGQVPGRSDGLQQRTERGPVEPASSEKVRINIGKSHMFNPSAVAAILGIS